MSDFVVLKISVVIELKVPIFHIEQIHMTYFFRPLYVCIAYISSALRLSMYSVYCTK